MSNEFWCFVEGDATPFSITAMPTISISNLKDKIKEKGKNGVLSNVDAKDLTLWKVRIL